MTYTIPSGYQAFAFESITVDNTAGGKALTAATYTVAESGNYALETTAQRAMITIEAHPVRFNTIPGVTVTATANGHYGSALDVIWLNSATQIKDFRAIRTTGSSAEIHVTYFK